MRIIENSKKANNYTIQDMTGGKLLALWGALEERRVTQELSAVEYDCWLQLNRFVEGFMPKLVKVHA